MVFRFSSIFDVDSAFDLTMIKVFIAREDLRKSVMLMSANEDDGHMLYFPFKVKIGYIKEAATLLHNVLFKKYMKELRQFENYKIILELKEEFDKQANKYCEFFKKIRDSSFHYKDTNDIKALFGSENFKDFGAEIILGEKQKDVHYNFTDEIYIQMFCKYFYKEEFTSDIEQIKINDMIKEIGNFGLLIMKILQELAEGFLESKAKQLEKIAD